MNYTEIGSDNEEPDPILTLTEKLVILRNASLPVVEPFPDDPVLEAMKDARGRYVACMDRMVRALGMIKMKQAELDTLMELVRKLGTVAYKDDLEKLLERVENEGGLTEAQKSLAESTAEYESLRKVFELVEEPSRYCCFTCLERSIEHVFIPCGHTVCTVCSERMSEISSCPFCRSVIHQRFKLFT